MKDILDKQDTQREASAQARLHAPADIIQRLRERALGKGDALEMARAAAILATKRTPELIPLCHPLPLRKATVDYEFDEESVRIVVTAACKGPTGVEMEVLTAASIAALTLYDMMKPEAGLEMVIDEVCLLHKSGGKSGLVRR